MLGRSDNISSHQCSSTNNEARVRRLSFGVTVFGLNLKFHFATLYESLVFPASVEWNHADNNRPLEKNFDPPLNFHSKQRYSSSSGEHIVRSIQKLTYWNAVFVHGGPKKP